MVDLHYITLPEGFLEEEVRNGVLVPAKLKEVWAIELDMLELVRIICEKYDIKYFAEGGTLLGAVREKGFIPWDNDVDVLMNMENYNRFIECARKEIKFPYRIKAKEIDPMYSGGHCLITREDTSILGIGNNQNFCSPIFLDILQWCSVPDDVRMRKTALMKIFALRWRMEYMFSKSYIRLINNYEKTKSNTIASVSIISPKYDINRLIEDKCNYIGKTLYMPFEFIKVPVPEKYEIILCHKYGVDWKIPQRGLGFHSSDVFIDTNKSYINYHMNLIDHYNIDRTGFGHIIKLIRKNIYNTSSCISDSDSDSDDIPNVKTNYTLCISNFDELIKWLRELPEEYAKIILFDYTKEGYTFKIADSEGNELCNSAIITDYQESAYQACKICINLLKSQLGIE